MNICDPRHEPKYQIVYKSAKSGNFTPKNTHYNPVWLVCDDCLKNKSYFGSKDQIESMEMLA